MDPLGHSSGLLGLLLLSNDIVKSGQQLKAAVKEVKSLQIQVAALFEILKALQPIIADASDQLLPPQLSRVVMDECYETLKETAILMEKFARQDKPGSYTSKFRMIFKTPFLRDQFHDLQKKLDQHRTTFSMVLSWYTSTNVSSLVRTAALPNAEIEDLRDQVRRLRDKSDQGVDLQIKAYHLQLQDSLEQGRQKILTWVSPFDFQAKHLELRSRRLNGTGRWLLGNAMFQSWQAGESLDVLWLEGIPGSGKSVLMSQAIDHLEELSASTGSIGLAYFYSDHREHQQNPTKLLASLLRQLLQQCSDLPTRVAESYQSMKSQGRFLSYDALKAFVKTVFVNFQRVYICIDALDEFPNNHISELFELLQILKEPQVAILVSSRPSSLHLQLSNFLRISTLEIRTHQTNDIALYTKSRFRQSQRLQSRPELQHFLIQEIIQRGDGMFLWVSLVVDLVLRQPSPKTMKDALHSLPRALAEVYDEVWLTLSRQDDQNKQVAYQVIGHLLKSATPLSLSTVQAILVANGGDAEESGSDPSTIIETCAGFVTLDTVNHRLCLIHASVREYLINLPVWTLVSDSLEIDISQYPSNDKSTGVVESKFAKQTDSGRDARDLAHLLEDEDVNSEISYSDSVFSQISRQTSQSSVFSQLETVTDQFARLYSSNEAIQETIVAALSAIGAAGFETIFAAELKTFSNDLQSLAKAPSQKIAAIMAGQRTRLIAKGTLREFEILENGDSAFFKLSTDERGGKAYLLDQYLKHRDPKKNTRKDEGQIESNQGPFQSNPAEESLNAHLDTVYLNKMDDFLKPVTQEAQLVDEEEEEDFGESYANLELVKDFIISEQPFDDLLERLRSKIAPADIVVDLPTFQIQVEDEGLPIFKSLRDDIARQDSLTLKDVIAILFVYLYQRWTRIFLRLEKPLKVGLQRVRWKCVCDLQFYDDFFEIDPGAVKEIQESLDAIYGPMSSVEAEDNPTPGKEEDIGDASLHTVDSAGIGSNIALPGLRQRGACRQQEGRDDNDFSPQAVPDNQQVATAESTSSSGLWIIPCFELSRSRNGTKAVHLNVTGGKYDAELFQSFREEYFKESSWFRRLFLLREVKAIKFINFGLSDLDEVDVRRYDVWPDSTDGHLWQYMPCPAPSFPLVGPKRLMHVWQNPHHADKATYEVWKRRATRLQRAIEWFRRLPERLRGRPLTTAKPQPGDGGEPPMSDVQVLRSARRSKVIYVRIPKKVGQKLRYNYGDDEGSEEEGWGILFEEGFKVHRLLFAILIIYVSGSLAFLGWMLHSFGGITTSTWSGYIAVISWVLSLFSLKVTVWFKWAENY